MKDWQLLQQWVEQCSETAFAQLVDRHIDFVHNCARRQVSDPSLAQDVTQAVFLLLSRKASSFGQSVILTSWLFRTTRFIATSAQRAEYRRLRLESSSAAMVVATLLCWPNSTTDTATAAMTPSTAVAPSTASVRLVSANTLTSLSSTKLSSSALRLQVLDDSTGSALSGTRVRIAAWGPTGSLPTEERQTDPNGFFHSRRARSKERCSNRSRGNSHRGALIVSPI